MKQPSISVLKKYLSAMGKIKKKYVTADRLSKEVGIYPEVINETLSFFDPMVNMDYEYNLLELVPQIKQYIEDKTIKKSKKKIILDLGEIIFPWKSSSFSDSSSSKESYKFFVLFIFILEF